jgi:hypothetical protein
MMRNSVNMRERRRRRKTKTVLSRIVMCRNSLATAGFPLKAARCKAVHPD